MVKLFLNGSTEIPFKVIQYPAGELHVRLFDDLGAYKLPENSELVIAIYFQNSDDIILAGLLSDAVRRHLGTTPSLFIPYFPSARQDRVVINGESLSLKFYLDLIQSMGFKDITVIDPHSSAFHMGVFNLDKFNIIEQHDMAIIFESIVSNGNSPFFSKSSTQKILICPDAGAYKKVGSFISSMKDSMGVEFSQVWVAEKSRDPSDGKLFISEIRNVDLEHLDSEADFYIVDDICDGGATFISIVDHIQTFMNVIDFDRFHLYTTHGIYSKGLEELETRFGNIACSNSLNFLYMEDVGNTAFKIFNKQTKITEE